MMNGAGPISRARRRAATTIRERLRESAPLLGIGAAFLAGALVASLGHVRLLNSVYPLWVLLAINGGIAAVAGSAILFVDEPDRPLDDDPTVVRVPRVQWEALLRRLEMASRATSSRAPGPEWSEASPVLADPRARAAEPLPPRALPPEPPSAASRAAQLRLELDALQVLGLAESAVATADTLGPPELAEMLRSSDEELREVAARWGVPAEPSEPTASVLGRLLALYLVPPGRPLGPRTRDQVRRLIARFEAHRRALPEPSEGGAAPGTKPPATPLGTPGDEVERLLEELEATHRPGAAKPSDPEGDGTEER